MLVRRANREDPFEKFRHNSRINRIMPQVYIRSITRSTCSMYQKVGVTIATKNDYCDSIDIAGSTIVILLLLWTTVAILLWYYCLKHSCLFEGEH